jgi:hypothetical protein
MLIRLTTLWFAVALGLWALLRLMREPGAPPPGTEPLGAAR